LASGAVVFRLLLCSPDWIRSGAAPLSLLSGSAAADFSIRLPLRAAVVVLVFDWGFLNLGF
jgi:hypothetical protein